MGYATTWVTHSDTNSGGGQQSILHPKTPFGHLNQKLPNFRQFSANLPQFTIQSGRFIKCFHLKKKEAKKENVARLLPNKATQHQIRIVALV